MKKSLIACVFVIAAAAAGGAGARSIYNSDGSFVTRHGNNIYFSDGTSATIR